MRKVFDIWAKGFRDFITNNKDNINTDSLLSTDYFISFNNSRGVNQQQRVSTISEILDLAKADPSLSGTGLEKVTEDGNDGWRFIGDSVTNKATIGDNAVDMSRFVADPDGAHPDADGDSSDTDYGASGFASTAIGNKNKATNDYSFAGGFGNRSTGWQSFAFGSNNLAAGTNAFIIGQRSEGNAEVIFSTGDNHTINEGYTAIVGGKNNTINTGADNSVIVGGTGITATEANTVYMPNAAVNGRIGVYNTGTSVFIGESAGLNDDLTNNENVFIGYQAGTNSTTGIRNVIIGKWANRNSVAGSSNTYIGYQSAYHTTSSYNTALGSGALYGYYSGSTPEYTTAIGRGSLGNIASGTNNTALGDNAISYLSTGSHNIGIGNDAGRYFQTGLANHNYLFSNSIFIGSDSRANASNESNQIVIGYNAIGNGSNTVTIGNSSVTDVYANQNGTAILHADGSQLINLPVSTMPSWADVTAVGNTSTGDIVVNGHIETTGTGNSVFIGEDAGLNDDLSNNNNTFIGTNAGKANTTGDRCVSIGYSAGWKSTTQSYNTNIGYFASGQNYTSNYVTALGAMSLYNNQGESNIGLGRSAGEFGGTTSTTGGESNNFSNNSIFIGNWTKSIPLTSAYAKTNQIVIGHMAVSQGENTFTAGNADLTDFYAGQDAQAIIRSGALYSESTGESLFVGKYAGSNDDGTTNQNTFIGRSSGYSNTSGYYNTVLGYSAYYNPTTNYYNTVVGYSAMYQGSGNFNTALGQNAMWASSGDYNIAIGSTALYSADGDNNIIIGKNAGRYDNASAAINDIDNSILIGTEARSYADSDTNEIVIGYTTTGKGSNTATIGNASITDIWLGQSAQANLHVNGIYDTSGSLGTAGYILSSTGTGTQWIVAPSGGGMTDPMTTRGDIIYRNPANSTDRLPVGTAGQVLTSDGTDVNWANPATSGDVVGPASATDDRIATFDGTTGKLIQDGGNTIAEVLARANHTGTQTASTISDFDTEVSNNVDVTANSAKVSCTTANVDSAGAVMESDFNAKGDLLSASADDTPLILSSGTNGQLLSVDTTTATGLKWVTPGGGGDMLIATYDPAGIGEQLVGINASQTITNKTINTASNTITVVAADVSDFDTEVSNNTDVAANTTHRGTVTGNPHNVTFAELSGTLSHTSLTDIGTNTHAQIDTHIGDSTIHFTQGAISITASQVSDFDTEVSNNASVVANTAKVTNATHTGDVTGDTVLTIANNIIDEPNLKVTNAPVDNYLLSYDSATSGFTWIPPGGTGTVTDVIAGNGLDFTTINTSGSVTLGTPSTITAATSNAVTTTSHTHELDESGITITATQVSDFDTEVSNNTDVTANTSARHNAVTLNASATTAGLSLSTQELSAVAASTSTNGYLTSTDWNTFNNKVSNATHTGEVTGSTALTIDKTAITNKTEVSIADSDYLLISDTSDGGNLKKVPASEFYNAWQPAYGELYIATDTNLTVSLTNTWYKITSLTSGAYSNTTLATDSITIDSGHAGDFKVDFSGSVSFNQGSSVINIGVFVNSSTTPEANIQAILSYPTSSLRLNIALSGILSLSSSDVVTVKIKSDTAGTFTTGMGNLSLHKIQHDAEL